MKYPIYAVKDRLVGFMQPMVEMNDDSAIRNFNYGLEKSGVKNSDYSLYRIGEYDTDSGIISSIQPEWIFEGKDGKKK